jgi:hypothetical protein
MFFLNLPGDMLVVLVEQHQREIREQFGHSHSTAPSRRRSEPARYLRALGRRRRGRVAPARPTT